MGGGGAWSGPAEGVGVGGRVQVFPDGVIMHGGSQRHEHVPDGVGEGDDAIALEEEDAQAVNETAARQLLETLRVALQEGGRTISTLRLGLSAQPPGGPKGPTEPLTHQYKEEINTGTMDATTEAGKKPMVR